MLSTSGSCAWMVNAPGPLPCDARQRQRVQPSPIAAAGHREREHQQAPTATRIRLARITIRLPAAPSCPAVRRPGWSRSAPRRPAAARPAAAGAAAGAPAAVAACAAAAVAAECSRPHPVLAVGDLVRPRRGTDEQVLTDRQEVVLAVLDDRRQVLHAQLRRLLGAQPRRGLNRAAEEGDRVGEVVDHRHAAHRALGGLIDVEKFWNVLGATCRICLTSSRLSISAWVTPPACPTWCRALRGCRPRRSGRRRPRR